MDTLPIASSQFLVFTAWSTVLLLLHIVLQAVLATRELGPVWNAGPRDDGKAPQGAIAGRAARALGNFRETYPAFIALAVVLALKGDPSGWGMAGAWIWAIARMVYIPLYLAGIPVIRSLVWTVSSAGLAVMFIAAIA